MVESQGFPCPLVVETVNAMTVLPSSFLMNCFCIGLGLKPELTFKALPV
jgi:hypothetical protein